MDYTSRGYYEHNAHMAPVEIKLKNENLWNSFHNECTEMIITKAGRRMFPSFDLALNNLDPNAHYCIALEFNLVSRCRYKYSTAGGWVPAGTEEAQSVHRFYMHPDSPATGEYWMKQSVSFNKVKLTNNPSPPLGQIVLSSMHKYQPTIIISKTADPRTMRWAPTISHTFKETQFIAVTAYQNDAITQLKIDNNPFAKGFRENGHSKTKKRRSNSDEIKDTPTKSAKLDLEETSSTTTEDERLSTSPLSSSPTVEPSYYPPMYPMYQSFYPPTSYYYPQYPLPMYLHSPSHYAVDLSRQEHVKPENKTSRLTDFSIKAILDNSA
ncbi:unnamed protein product [Brassicogethes aeneus]|uniref:T-box domain-containing protein n=1 Tax=Brassicogethes aeneus TaxID=1431903 RepID=A0A9P0B562_BRAAE|nr:unnamed protein product [Brassicogethes aeneus]